ncbi:LOW QUALITY PROTEIN: DNA excision repair protein ERCC-6-like 2 [Gracilinanus agilis]|uniref:LOW QUALITY PROTEIN: DNA excision repair protein ERCC-6-like 2 n=1 Tax=Gracilinanus agilis TaxID=191870 RepID=UPI001CFE6F1B|nr:LOW QUALITY PROTEIN: DNA excision repair protein ERCC-6-like 2 [Gracilinanus agilis]
MTHDRDSLGEKTFHKLFGSPSPASGSKSRSSKSRVCPPGSFSRLAAACVLRRTASAEAGALSLRPLPAAARAPSVSRQVGRGPRAPKVSDSSLSSSSDGSSCSRAVDPWGESRRTILTLCICYPYFSLFPQIFFTKPFLISTAASKWNIGERCLVPATESGKFCEAAVKSIMTDENGKSFALVLFSGSLEKKVPLKKLQKATYDKSPFRSFMFDDIDLEKPYFPDRKLPSPAVAFKLSEDGNFIPYTINRYLRDYQREGARFLYGHYSLGRGCILGDDMGLGKTVQVISFLAAVLCKKGTREDIENNMPEFLLKNMKKESSTSAPKKMFLIVAPLSVLYNWKDELNTWGYFKVTILHGNKKDNELNRVKQGKCEIALTTYETLRLCLDDLNSIEWSAVIVDEAHRIKNPKARVTEVMKALKCNVRIGLTGTILQNNMKELWCVMDWAVPGLLGSMTYFKKQFSDPVEHGQRHTATRRELATGRKAMQRLARKMSGWFLRRTKTLIRDQLPKKEDRMVYCSLTEFQKAVYQTVLETEDVTLILRAREPCTCNSGRKRKNCCYKTNSYGETMKALYFSYLSILQKVSNHAALLQASSNTSKQQEAHLKRICNQVFSKFKDFMQKSKDAAFETISDPKYSGKMKVLQQLLNHCKKNRDKVLLFSYSTKLLDVLEQYCMATGLDYRRLDGSTKSEERVKIVKEFNSTQDINICLVSTMAGGLGLNFVGANVVVIFDPTWNPANDLQAIDRAYRIGQCRDVKVFRLISLGTVEEIMYLRQVYKQQLHCVVVGSENAKRYFEAVQGSKEHQGELFGIHNLFKLRSQGSCLTRDILEREGQVEAGVMTATTWLKEGPPTHKLEMTEDLECQEHKKQGQSDEVLEKEVFDLYCDFSDEESMGSSRTKTAKNKISDKNNTTVSPGQLTLLQCGFSKLFEEKSDLLEDSDENVDSNDESSDDQSLYHLAEPTDNTVVDYQKSQSPHNTLLHQKIINNLNQKEKFKYQRRPETLKGNVSSDSDSERDLKNKEEQHCALSKTTETEDSSDDSDVIFPTQLVTQKLLSSKNYEQVFAASEDSKAERPFKMTTSVDHCSSSKNSGFSVNYSTYKKIDHPQNVVQKSIKETKNVSDISDESDDIDISSELRIRKKTTSSIKFKPKKGSKMKLHDKLEVCQLHSSDLESDTHSINDFSSSDDDSTASKITFSKQNHWQKSKKCKLSFSTESTDYNKKNINFLQWEPKVLSNEDGGIIEEQKGESMDNFLDGVQEVAYIHSNQNVIGSSKAENHMSRWATRDVFELKQFSQLPANIAVCSPKTCERRKKDSYTKILKKEQQPNKENHLLPLYITHPVISKKKDIYHVDQTTFIMGETPKGIRRKQFEEMASFFNLSSIKEFAELITSATSEERQKILRDFYSSRYPEIKEFFADHDSELIKSKHEEEENVKTKSRKRKSYMEKKRSDSGPSVIKVSTSRTTQNCSPKRHKEEINKFKNDNSCGEVLSNDAETEELSSGFTQEIVTEKKSQAFKDTSVSNTSNSKSETCKRMLVNTIKDQQDFTRTDCSRSEPLLKFENKKLENQTLEGNTVVDLLGDTSILDDLFKSHGDSTKQLPRKALSKPKEKPKQRPRDFWDILNEQNDDSLSKFTDLAVIETLCEKAPLATSTKRNEELEMSLWKSNEKFLWKKSDPNDSHESTPSK